MANRERYHAKRKIQILPPATVSASGGTDYVDVQLFDAASFLIHTGELGSLDDSNLLAFKLQHADETPGTAGSYEDVPITQLRGDINADGELIVGSTPDENTVKEIAYVGNRRYLRLVWTETGAVSGPLAVTFIGELATQQPANAVAVATGAVT